MTRPPFSAGDPVRDRRNPAEPGTVLSLDYDDQLDEWFVKVRFGTRITSLEASRLEGAGGSHDPWEDLAAGVAGSARSLRTLLTYERLRVPPGPVGASFGTARARLFPFQFKPLVKFLENPTHSLLIADEVGLGKTIEAGYIHREWKLRHTVDNVLIVVPARLRTKWRDEMAHRFDERFEIAGAKEVLRTLSVVRSGRDPDPFQWVCSYESLRRRDVIDGLREVSPPLDLVILDEAHRVRNRETLHHQLARALCDSAQAKLFLSATPLQTGLDNLHALLDLLEPGAFGSAQDFPAFIDANRPVVRATAFAGLGRFEDAAQALEPLLHHRELGPAVGELLAELQGAEPTRTSRVRLQAAIGDLSLTGHTITRTRKVEVMEERPLRTAQTVHVELTEPEWGVYRAVEEFTRLLYGDGGWGQRMAALTAYRYTASCIPAAIEYMRARLEANGKLDAVDEVDADFADEGAWDEDVPFQGTLLQQALAYDVRRWGDSKRDKLFEALHALWADDDRARRPRRKVVLFSFFKRTLSYLSDQLRSRGIHHERVDGGVPLFDREERITRFLTEPDCPLLVSSEVGGEGLDLQAASVVVNYDLPWNPMVVEQRIGRVDRIGQMSERIVIINLVCKGTVEDRILYRLYDRIHLFEASIGEIEEILGAQEVQDLIIEYLRGSLTEAEMLRRVDDTANAAVRKKEQAESLVAQVDGLLAADQAILDQLKLLVDGNRLPGPIDIVDLVRGYLETAWPGVRLDGDPLRGVAELDLPPEARRAFHAWSSTNQGSGSTLLGAMRRGPVTVTADGDTAMRNPRVEFLQARHPLVQFAVEGMAQRSTRTGNAFACRVRLPALASGPWIVGIWSLTRGGLDNDTELVCAAAPVGGRGGALLGDDAEDLLRTLLGQVDESDPPPVVEPDTVRRVGSRTRIAFARHRAELEEAARAEARRRLARKRASWSTSLLQQVRRAEEHLGRMRDEGKPFAVRMAEAKLKKWQVQHDRVLEELSADPDVRLDDREVAVVLVDNVGA